MIAPGETLPGLCEFRRQERLEGHAPVGLHPHASLCYAFENAAHRDAAQQSGGAIMMKFVGAGIALASLVVAYGGASANEDTDAAYRAAACLTLQAYIDGEYDWLNRENQWVKKMSDRVGSSNSVVQNRALRADAVRRHVEFLKSEHKRLCWGSLKKNRCRPCARPMTPSCAN